MREIGATVGIYLDNDTLVEVDALTNEATAEVISDATVAVTLYNAVTLAEVTGQAWPATLIAVVGEAGSYRAVMDKTVEVVEGEFYTARVTAATTGGIDASWDVTLFAARRAA